ncbi:MAG: esterase-like activity of phytase family protein [Pseudomonadota bacterium]|nr:esterase-like activity of phytase family protein [Pseudomonadota bacterium]
MTPIQSLMRRIHPFGALLAVMLLAGGARGDSLQPIAQFDWVTDSVTGLSGIEVASDGMAFHMVSDRGWFLTGRFERDAETISGLVLDRIDPILGIDGLPVSARRLGDWSDAEGLAMAPDGTYWISFERWARVAPYAPGGPDEGAGLPKAGWIRDHLDFATYADNRQLEALAIAPDGTLYTFAEQPLAGDFAIYRLTDGTTWEVAGHIAPQDRFAIVGADFGPDGQLYLLERKLRLGLWWQNRIRRLSVDAPDEIETLWTGAPGAYGNLEGLALWMRGDEIRAIAVSDTNGAPHEPTQFVEFRLIRAPS